MTQVMRAKPGTWRGVKYRSQLEIKWAKWLEMMRENTHTEWDVRYTDEADHDFSVSHDTRYGSVEMHIEIKPAVKDLCSEALRRTDWSKYSSSGSTRHWIYRDWCLLIGPPPTQYSRPACLYFRFTQAHGLDGPWISTAAIVNGCEWFVSPRRFYRGCFDFEPRKLRSSILDQSDLEEFGEEDNQAIEELINAITVSEGFWQ